MSSDTILKTASDAYVYFYPVVENMKTLFFNSVWPHTESYLGPVNKFFHYTKLIDWTVTDFPNANNDTLYSIVWLDLDERPIILSLPEVHPTSSGKKVRRPGHLHASECHWLF